MNEAKKAIEFAQPREGNEATLSSKEKLEAALKFKSLLDDTFLRFADKVKVSKDELNGTTESHLNLNIHMTDGTRLDATLVSRSKGLSSESAYVAIQEIVEGTGGKTHRYHTENGQDVRRFDREAHLPSSLPSIDFRGDPVLVRQQLEAQIEDMNNLFENRRLEKAMGLNDQPVGINEVIALDQILLDAEPSLMP